MGAVFKKEFKAMFTQPIGCVVLAVLFAGLAAPLMPGLMAFSAGAMMLVVAQEMIPEAAKERFGVYAVMAGYALMMALDVGLG